MAKIKGTILIDFVKTIRADKTGAYDSFLTDRDREVVEGRILPSGWYDYQTFKNCFNAVVEVLAKGDMESVRQWGRLYGENIVTGVYKGVIKEGNPAASLKKYNTFIRNLYDFGEIEVDMNSENEALVSFKSFDPDFVPQFYMMMGWIERSLELCGAKNISCVFEQKSWEGAPLTSIRFKWTV